MVSDKVASDDVPNEVGWSGSRAKMDRLIEIRELQDAVLPQELAAGAE
jgi:hypothetical protein